MPDERYDLDKLALPEEEALARVEGGAGRTSRYPEPSYSYQEKLDETASAYLRELWRRIRKHQVLIFFLVLISTTIVTIEAFRTKSIYRAATTIELDKASRTVYRSGETTIESDEVDYPFFTSIAMKTSIRFLKSRPVLEDVVLALKLDENPRFLDVTSRKSIIESARTVLSRIKSTKPEPFRPAVVESPDIAAASLTTRSPEESARLAPYVGVLSGNLSGTQVEDTRMLMISVDHTDPALAASIANTAARAFMESSYRSRVRRLNSTSDWLDRKTRELEAKVQQSELNLANFASENNMIATGDARENLTVEKLSNMWGQFLKAQVDRILKESLYDEVRQGRVAQLPEAYADPKTSALRGRLDELTLQAAQYAGRFGPENPKVVDMNKQVAALQRQLEESRATLEDRLKADYERTKRDEKAFQEAFERARGDAVQQNSSVIRYGMLKQEVEISKAIYQSFLTQSSHADLQKAEQGNNSRVIEPAFVPTMPVGPNRLRTILIGLLASLGLGIAIALLIEYLNNTVKTVEDVSRYALLPTLGVIPVIGGRKVGMFSNGNRNPTPRLISLIPEQPPNQQLSARLSRRLRNGPVSDTSLGEAYRGLRTSILLSAAGHAPKTILFTSSQPSEGKTTTTINTAISLAQLGASVLIIDADLRRPSTHRVFKVNHTPGLSTFLSREVGLDGLVQELPTPNLSLLTCGPVPPNPSELISSIRMKEVLRIASERYDHVLIDSPPLINVSDALILSTLVDGVILIVQGGRTSRGVVRRARMELAGVGAKIFGVVLNNVDWKRDGYHDAYYYRRYYSSDYESDREVEQESSNGD